MFTWSFLATAAGTIAFAMAASEVAKRAFGLAAAVTRIVVLVCVAVVQSVVLWRAGITPETVVTAVANVGILWLAAMGLYEKSKYGIGGVMINDPGDEPDDMDEVGADDAPA